jgi:uncharacterized iron-regulated protein
MARERMQVFWFVLVIILFWGCASSGEISNPHDSPYRTIETVQEGTILHVPTGLEISKEQLFDLLAERRIVYIGEAHTNLAHHRVQLEILRAMEDRYPGQIALGLEMFDRTRQPLLDRWVDGKVDQKDFLKAWYDSWAMDYDYYRAILEYARDQWIPIIALNASDEEVRELSEKGLDGLSEERQKDLPEIDSTDPYHRKSLEAVFRGHGPSRQGEGHEKTDFDRFYQTMLLWDETMAQSVAEFLNSPAGEGKRMVVLAGGFHVGFGFGIPRRVFRRVPVSYAIVLPQTDKVPKGREDLLMNVNPPALPLLVADFIWKTVYEDIDEKRVRLGVYIEKGEGGITIREVSRGSAAEKAGLKAGDRILFMDGEPIEDIFDLTYLVRLKQAGQKATLQYSRDGEVVEAEVTFEPSGHP